MRLTRGLCLAGFVWLWLAPNTMADNPTPVPPATIPVVIQPTAALPEAQPTVPVVPQPVSTPEAPVLVAPEKHQVLGSTPLPVEPQATLPPDTGYPTPSTSAPSLSTTTRQTKVENSSSSSKLSNAGTLASQTAAGVTDLSAASSSALIDPGAQSVSAAAPAQLACHGNGKPAADPFMVAPYAGWADINSFLDHDSPDYTLDGKIVTANGLTATSADGSSSDFFPSYWSDALRQYISYDGHNGYDFGISYQPVLAAASGKVEFAGWNGPSEFDGYGQMVIIDHGNGYATLYGHLSQLEVKTGDRVQSGQEIGISGSTGRSTGPHLHFSVFHNCQVTDPYGWTGKGTDPLRIFDGETARYLWLPGQDPLVLNPPPNWPTYPLGLKVQVPALERFRHIGKRFVPPADRLLLLQVPGVPRGARVSSTVALARTEASVTQEGEQLVPYLQDLEAQNLVSSYQLIPAAAAVWVRGTVTAGQLQGLPGVASLSGARPQDLGAAQVGLAHSVLSQVNRQRAPSLWPAGFRSALQTWQPVGAVLQGHALVAGFALPGGTVRLTMTHGGTVVATARTVADADTGGFVAMLHRPSGLPLPVAAGDVVEIRSGGRSANIPVNSLTLRARTGSIKGTAQPGATLEVAAGVPGDPSMFKKIVTVDAHGRFKLTLTHPLAAGTLAVAGAVDAAGNQDSASAFVPGLLVQEGTSTVRGWAVGHHPRLQISRRGVTLLSRLLPLADDGSFQIALHRTGASNLVEAGDIATIGSVAHHRTIRLPMLAVTVTPGKKAIVVHGPPGSSVDVILTSGSGMQWVRTVTGRGPTAVTVPWPHGTIATGDAATARYVLPTGDTVETSQEALGLTAMEGTPNVRGSMQPGATVSIHLSGVAGQTLASAVAGSDPTTGYFSASLQDNVGRPVALRAGMRLTVRDHLGAYSFVLPAIFLQREKSTLLGSIPRGLPGRLLVAAGSAHRLVQTSRAKLLTARVPATKSWSASLAVTAAPGIEVEQDLRVAAPRRHTAPNVALTTRSKHLARVRHSTGG